MKAHVQQPEAIMIALPLLFLPLPVALDGLSLPDAVAVAGRRAVASTTDVRYHVIRYSSPPRQSLTASRRTA